MFLLTRLLSVVPLQLTVVEDINLSVFVHLFCFFKAKLSKYIFKMIYSYTTAREVALPNLSFASLGTVSAASNSSPFSDIRFCPQL